MNNPHISKGWIAAIIIAAVVIIDQAIKIWVKCSFALYEDLRITDWFILRFVENNGMAFGMEWGPKLFLTWFRIIAVGLLIYYITRLCKKATIPTGYLVCISLITCLIFLHGLGSVGIGTVIAALLVGIELRMITHRFGRWRDNLLGKKLGI